MLTHEDYQSAAMKCLTYFANLHPDCGFTSDSSSIRVIEPDRFIDAIMDAPSKVKASREECEKNHNGNDAILIRGDERSTIILKYDADKPVVMLLISIFHEMAHEYVMNREEESGYSLPELNKEEGNKSADELPYPFGCASGEGDLVNGYLLWKEFIADYLSYDALHHIIKRIPAAGEQGIKAMEQLIPGMCSGTDSSTTGAYSAMANACAIIMNFDGFQPALYGRKLKFPVNRRKQAGRAFYDMYLELLMLLDDRIGIDNPYAIDNEFVTNLGYTAVEVKLFHDDYDDEVGWQ